MHSPSAGPELGAERNRAHPVEEAQDAGVDIAQHREARQKRRQHQRRDQRSVQIGDVSRALRRITHLQHAHQRRVVPHSPSKQHANANRGDNIRAAA
jgi:thiamine monophosphate synthase